MRAPASSRRHTTVPRRRPASPVMAGEKTLGTFGSAAAGRGIALLRLDRVADALAAGAPIVGRWRADSNHRKAVWAKFRFREDVKAANEQKIQHADGLVRCAWPKDDPLYVAYHDEEWGVPEFDDRALYEKLILDGFQAGLSWITILRKRDNFRRAFDGFEPEIIAKYGKRKVDVADERRRHRAQPRQDRRRDRLGAAGSRSWRRGRAFRDLLWDFRRRPAQGQPLQAQRQIPAETPLSRAMSKELAGRGFKFVGPTIVYAFMQAVGMVNDHLVTCHRHEACAAIRPKR